MSLFNVRTLRRVTGPPPTQNPALPNAAIWKKNIDVIFQAAKILNAVKDGEFLAVHCKGVGNGQGPSFERAQILLAYNQQRLTEYGHAKDEKTGWIYVDVINGKFGRDAFPMVNVLMKAYGNLEFDEVKIVKWRK